MLQLYKNNGVQLMERAEVIKNYREFLEFEKSGYSLLLYSSPSFRPIPFRGAKIIGILTSESWSKASWN